MAHTLTITGETLDENLRLRLIEDRHVEYIENIHTWHKWRAAINSDLKGDEPAKDPKLTKVAGKKDVKHLVEGGIGRKSYLWPFSHLEIGEARRVRWLHTIDFGASEKVVAIYRGHSVETKASVETPFSDEIETKIFENVDNCGRTLAVFAGDVFAEIYGMGKSIVFTNAPAGQIPKVVDGKVQMADGKPVMVDRPNDEIIPFMTLIQREDFLDWDEDKESSEGGLRFAKWRTTRTKDEKYGNKIIKQIWAVDREEVTILEDGENGDYTHVIRFPNALRRVPVRVATMGRHANALTSVVCEMQIGEMNSYSVLKQLLNNQCLAILTYPQGTKIETLTSTTKIEVPLDGAKDVKWVQYAATTLESHFKNLEMLKERVRDASMQRKKDLNSPESAESKHWDFMDMITNLIVGHAAHTGLMTGVFKDMALLRGEPEDKAKYENVSEFAHITAAKQLELAQIVEDLPIGETSLTVYFKGLRDKATPNLTPKQRKDSDKEIETLIGLITKRKTSAPPGASLSTEGLEPNIEENNN